MELLSEGGGANVEVRGGAVFGARAGVRVGARVKQPSADDPWLRHSKAKI